MAVKEELEWLGQALMDLAHRAGLPLVVLSRELGHHDNYLTRTFRGRLPLKVVDVFWLLERLSVDSELFFELLWPFGGDEAGYVRRRPPAEYRPDERLAQHRLKLRAERGEDVFTPADWAAKAAVCLRELLRRKRVTQRAASLAAGMGPDALGQALRGNTLLTFQHVFATLEASGSPPGRFFTDLFGAPDGDLLEGLKWSMYLDELEVGFADFAKRAASQLKASRGHDSDPPPRSGPPARLPPPPVKRVRRS